MSLNSFVTYLSDSIKIYVYDISRLTNMTSYLCLINVETYNIPNLRL